MKVILLIGLGLILSGCNKNSVIRHDKFGKIKKENCLVDLFMCKVTIGRYSYCKSSNTRSDVAIDCKVYEETKMLMEKNDADL